MSMCSRRSVITNPIKMNSKIIDDLKSTVDLAEATVLQPCTIRLDFPQFEDRNQLHGFIKQNTLKGSTISQMIRWSLQAPLTLRQCYGMESRDGKDTRSSNMGAVYSSPLPRFGSLDYDDLGEALSMLQ